MRLIWLTTGIIFGIVFFSKDGCLEEIKKNKYSRTPIKDSVSTIFSWIMDSSLLTIFVGCGIWLISFILFSIGVDSPSERDTHSTWSFYINEVDNYEEPNYIVVSGDYYKYRRTLSKGEVTEQIPREMTYIEYDDIGSPKIEVHTITYHGHPFIEKWLYEGLIPNSNRTQNEYYTIIIPEGSVKGG